MKFYIGIAILVLLIAVSCGEPTVTPKPMAYNRIDIPVEESKRFSFPLFSFEYPESVRIDTIKSPDKNEFWFNVIYPRYNAVIHCTYLDITPQTLSKALDDSYRLAYSHTLRADGINQHVFDNPTEKVSGILYEIEGDVATPAQFFVTDSVRHFLRGSFYYSSKANPDSVAPVTEYVLKNIQQMMKSIVWGE